MKKRNSLLCTGIIVALAQPAWARDSVELSDTITVDGQTQFRLEVGVGSIELKHHDQASVSIEVEVEAGDGWFSSKDLTDVELEKRVSGDRISVSIDEEDTEQHWVVYVPYDINLDVSMGVGSVDLDGVSADLDLDIGVGDGDVSVSGNNYSEISLETGVGGASLRGFSGESRSRSIVSEEVSWRGDGQYEIEVDVGVGDIKVKG